MSHGDPTDDALATIASILDHPESGREVEKSGTDNRPEGRAADGYHKVSPGPIAAIRFKWTVRRADNGEYFVDETIGDGSTPVVAGPMSDDAAIRFVDDREREARQRFETLRSEMSGRDTAANSIGKAGGGM